MLKIMNKFKRNNVKRAVEFFNSRFVFCCDEVLKYVSVNLKRNKKLNICSKTDKNTQKNVKT